MSWNMKAYERGERHAADVVVAARVSRADVLAALSAAYVALSDSDAVSEFECGFTAQAMRSGWSPLMVREVSA